MFFALFIELFQSNLFFKSLPIGKIYTCRKKNELENQHFIEKYKEVNNLLRIQTTIQ